MATSEEGLKILKMIQEGKISVEQGMQLLEAVRSGNKAGPPGGSQFTAGCFHRPASGALVPSACDRHGYRVGARQYSYADLCSDNWIQAGSAFFAGSGGDG